MTSAKKFASEAISERRRSRMTCQTICSSFVSWRAISNVLDGIVAYCDSPLACEQDRTCHTQARRSEIVLRARQIVALIRTGVR